MSIWDFLLSGLFYLVEFMILPMFPPASDSGFTALLASMSSGAYTLFELVWVTFSMFDIRAWGIFFGIWFSFSVVKIVVSVYLTIKSLIPTA